MEIKEKLLTISKFTRTGKKTITPKFLTIHFTNKPKQSANGCYEYFEWLGKQADSGVKYGSCHYIIGLDGEVIRCIPEHEVAYHNGSSDLDPKSGKVYTDLKRQLCGGVEPNNCSIGIEVCHPDISGQFSAPSMLSLIYLAKEIIARHGLKENQLVRHYDIVGWKQCPKYYVENDHAWQTFKSIVFAVKP